MIHIVFYEQGGIYYGFEETGHSGFDEAGHDVVCAAVSAMTMFLINTVEVGYACDIQYTIDEKTTDVRILAASALPEYEPDEKKQFAVAGLLQSYYLQLCDMLEDYYEYLDVKCVEKPYDEVLAEQKYSE